MKTRNPTKALLERPLRASLALLILAGGASFALASAGVAAAVGATALSPSTDAVSSLCAAPSPGRASCLGLKLVPRSPTSVPGVRARAEATGRPSAGAHAAGADPAAVEYTEPWEESLKPSELLSAYDLNVTAPKSTQTIALVDAYNDLGAEGDLDTYDKEFQLPECTDANGCFEKVNQSGEAANPPFPRTAAELKSARKSRPEEAELAEGWAGEIATDVEVAHGLCPSCLVLLVEADSSSNVDLYSAEQTAAGLGATEISNSWGGSEPSGDEAAFDDPGVVITAASGDDGYLNWLNGELPEAAQYPASSPHVIAVGGTRLNLNESTKDWESETVWNDGGETEGVKEGFGAGGGGCSAVFTAPAWQQDLSDWSSVGCEGAHRAVADVSADADPYTGVAVYDSTESPEGERGWGMIGGTSVASPIIASVFALAGGAQGVAYPARTLYENAVSAPTSLHDVRSGSSGECQKAFERDTGSSGCSAAEEAASSCSGRLICLAGSGYDGPTGVGTPRGIRAFQATGAGEGESPASSSETGEEAQLGTPKGTSSPGTGAAGAEAGPAAATGAGSPGTAGIASAGAATGVPLLSALTLTHSAIIALDRGLPRLSEVGFSFTLSVGARVRVSLSRRTHARGGARWHLVARATTILARAGRQSRRLSARGTLPSGRYELMLAPERGTARSLFFQIG